MRLSRIWRILQVEGSVIHRGRRPRWITPSEICRILHILRKPNSIIALLFIQNIIFAQTCKLCSRPFLSSLNDTASCPGFLGQWFNNLWRQLFNNLQRAALLTSFWRQWFNNLQRTALLTSLVQYDRILGEHGSCLWWIMRVVLTNQKRGHIWMNNNKLYCLCPLCKVGWASLTILRSVVKRVYFNLITDAFSSSTIKRLETLIHYISTVLHTAGPQEIWIDQLGFSRRKKF